MLTIEPVRYIDKRLLAQRGGHPGLLHIFSAMEPCHSFRPSYAKQSRKTCLKPKEAKCLNYYSTSSILWYFS